MYFIQFRKYFTIKIINKLNYILPKRNKQIWYFKDLLKTLNMI